MQHAGSRWMMLAGCHNRKHCRPAGLILLAMVLSSRSSLAQLSWRDSMETKFAAVSVQPTYTGEVFSNTRGGRSVDGATRYLGLLDLAVEIDFSQSSCDLPGRFFLLGQTTQGQGLTRDFVGDTQVVSNIDPNRNIAQISEYWWECGLCDDDVVIRLGKQDLNTEFLLMESAAGFIHSAFSLSPAEGLPSYPNPSMSAVLLAHLTPSVTLRLGVWDALADGGTWGLSGNDVMLMAGELECRYALHHGNLPGTISVGLGVGTSGVIPQGPVPSSRGYYVQVEQLVWRECSSADESLQGLGVFGQYLPSDSSGPFPVPVIPEDVAVGFVYTGLIHGRDRDACGAGLAWARLENGGTNQETAVEVFYKAQLSPEMSVQPSLQYIATPSGLYRDALVAGVRCQLTW